MTNLLALVLSRITNYRINRLGSSLNRLSENQQKWNILNCYHSAKTPSGHFVYVLKTFPGFQNYCGFESAVDHAVFGRNEGQFFISDNTPECLNVTKVTIPIN